MKILEYLLVLMQLISTFETYLNTALNADVSTRPVCCPNVTN